MNEKNDPKTIFLYDLPFSPTHLIQSLTKSHKIFQLNPFKNTKLGFSLLLPNNWKTKKDIQEEKKEFPSWSLVGSFSAKKEKETPGIKVFTTILGFESNLVDILSLFCLYKGWKLFAFRIWKKNSFQFVIDGGALFYENDILYLARIMVFDYSKHIFLVVGICKATRWDVYKNIFLVGCSSFTFQNKSENQPIQPFQIFKGGDPFLQLKIPKNWTIEEERETPKGISAFQVELLHKEDVLGYIFVKSSLINYEKRIGFQDLLNEALEELTISGFKIYGIPIFIPGKAFLGSFALKGWVKGEQNFDPFALSIENYIGTAIIPGIIGEQIVEARLGFRYLETVACSIYLISSTQYNSNILWLLSKKAFEIIRENLWDDEDSHKNRNKYKYKYQYQNQNQNWDENLDEKIIIKLEKGLNGLGWEMISENSIISHSDCKSFGIKNLQQPKWLNDQGTKVCMNCKKKFTVRRRRHHCRHCGLIFCKKCSTKKQIIPKFHLEKPVRVCDNCFKILEEGDSFANIIINQNDQKNQKNAKSKKKIKNNFRWKNCGDGTFIELEEWIDSDVNLSTKITKTLENQSKKKVIRVEKVNSSQKENPNIEVLDLKQEEENEHIIYKLNQDKMKIGTQLINVEGRWYDCVVWKSSSLNSSQIYQWINDSIPFPIKTFKASQESYVFKEIILTKIKEELKIAKKTLICLKFEGIYQNENGEKFNDIIWVSDKVPGGIVKEQKQLANNRLLSIEMKNFKIIYPEKQEKFNSEK
ncbi:hepatocyte growth factor-regulated tyrosine kinase substrate [Anaeramoeba ignava]|uniref:Hepatocyte growth factor-regulated tyrosine kinase substrate n=1 Tax=Anaeramoeba ignava TaxID=1746090 RepID=A0A9Q0LD66_ANAIG|nr:hepatocyte growth factor-regulated tyrosine kinase substrate [Anaeramoeba ignava]